jgi:quinoprotein glucose dehydrogenase
MLSGWTAGGRYQGRWRLTAVLAGIGLAVVGASYGSPLIGQEKSASSGIYSDAQAERGKAVYAEQCAFCHLEDLTGQGFAPPLVDDAFAQRWQDGNVGDLFTIVKVTMPQDKPQSLTDAQYAEIVAYMLKMNKFPAGAQDLPSDAAALKVVTFKKP